MAGQICTPPLRNVCARTLSLTAAVVAASGLFAADTAEADVYGFDWNRPAVFDGNAGPVFVSDEAGVITNFTTEFDSDNQTLSLFATFEEEPVTNELPLGFFLVLNNGPMPMGMDGQYAMLYFEVASNATPTITAYAYNGENGADSFFDGAAAPGNQTPDPIISSLNDPGFVTSASSVDNPGGRVLSFTIDTTAINAHNPLHGNPANWEGIGFDENIGIWFHPYSNLNPIYGVDGFLEPSADGTSWLEWDLYIDQGEEYHGWLDADNLQSDIFIPEPASLALIGLGAAALLSCGRRDA